MHFLVNSRKGWVLALFWATATVASAGDNLTKSAFPDSMVASAHGLKAIDSGGSGWAAEVTDPADPYLELVPTAIDADRHKYLTIELEVSARAGLQVFFSGQAGTFSEDRTFRPARRLNTGRCVYQIDLRKLANWKGKVRALRLDLEQLNAGDRIRLYRVGTAAEPAPAGDTQVIQVSPRLPPSPGEPVRTERLAAFHKTVVVTDEQVPNSAVFTYVSKRFTYTENNLLAKMVPLVATGSGVVTAEWAEQVRVEDTPGGVTASFVMANTRVKTEVTPLLVGRGAATPEGAALYIISTDPPAPMRVRIGSGKTLTLIGGSDNAGLRSEDLSPMAGGVQVVDRVARYLAGEEQIPVAIAGSGQLTVEGQTLTATFPDGHGQLVIAFAEGAERAAELAGMDASQAARRVADYYQQMWSANHIETPEPLINDAFKHALRTLEYTWLEPLGWLECIHHWLSLWHMQATAGAEWIGQQDRSRTCTLTHAARLTSEGAVPQFSPTGHVHRDFGGSNQYWAWQVRHYWQFTGDRAFAEQAAPALDKVLAQTAREYDRDHNRLLAWGLQIGNQEDYVATPYDGTTPSIEGINMMLTRAELARALGDNATAGDWEQRAARARALLRERLWMRDLGRFAFFVDPHGSRRLDGQYHTLAYPAIWGITDDLDSYTTLRHLHDRLIGSGGEVYCSNNFPNHVGGTWGMQAGAAQQPWAAWAFSAAGQFEHTYRPLKAVAEWVMNRDHRGSWPEVAIEPTPAYFSPPAGLFVASTVEALFGLKVDAPNRVLNVSPSFPSHWPSARLKLAEYSATYKRDDNRIEYTVQSTQPLERHFFWHLPPSRITRVLVDGREAAFNTEPGANSVIVRTDTPAAVSTTFAIEFEPSAYRCIAPPSVAQGETFRLQLDGLSVEKIDDRCGVLSQVSTEGQDQIVGTVRHDLLEPYQRFGRLGQLVFSRRTVFALCSTRERDACFWTPIDLTVLPRYEVAPARDLRATAEGVIAEVLIRNNTAMPLKGVGTLSVAGGDHGFTCDIAPRSEQKVTVTLSPSNAGLLCLGDNRATVTLPGQAGALETVLSVTELFTSVEPLARAVKASLEPVALDESAMIPDTQWTTLRVCPAYPHMPWAGSRPPLESLAGKKTLASPDLPHVEFALPHRKFIPVSFKSGRPAYCLDLKGRMCRKLFLLVVPFLDNHDMFAQVGRVTVRSPEDIVHSETLSFPGDADWWSPPAIVGDFATIGKEPRDRHGLLPLLAADRTDWAEGRPPAFPQPRFWSSSRLVVTPSSVMSIIEIDLGRYTEVKSLTLESIGVDPAFGMVAVTALTAQGQSLLEGTPWNPPASYRQPRTIFNFEQQSDLAAWRIEGNAFSVSPFPSLFATPTLNSLSKVGEAATGKAVSPDFELKPADTTLMIQYHGGRSKTDDGAGLMAIDLVDAKSGQRLYRLALSADHTLRWEHIDVKPWAGRSVRLELTDQNTDPSYAWLGLAALNIESE
jgi:hypothetical protein